MFIFYVFLFIIGILGTIAIGLNISQEIEHTTIYILFWMLYLVTITTFANIIASGYYYYRMKDKRGPQGPRGEIGEPGVKGEVGQCASECRDNICSTQIMDAIMQRLHDRTDENTPISINNVYIKQKVKQMCSSNEFKQIAPFKGPQKLISYLIKVWQEWTDLLFDAAGLRYFETIGAEMEFEWLAENPFNTIKKYDVFYWGLGNNYKPRIINDCKTKQLDGNTLSVVSLIKTNLYESITDTSGISSVNQASFWRPKIITYKGTVYYPLGDIVGSIDNKDNKNVRRFTGNLKLSTKQKSPNKETMLVSGDVKPPFKYNLIWDTSTIGSNKNFWIWRPIGPKTKNGHYLALGDVITTTPYPPPTGIAAPIRCIHESALTKINHNRKIVWSSKGSSDSLIQTNILGFQRLDERYTTASDRNGYHLFRSTKGLLNMIDPEDKNEQFYMVNSANIDNTNIPGKINLNNTTVNTEKIGDGYKKVGKKNGSFSVQAFLSLKENGIIKHQDSNKRFYISLSNVGNANSYLVSFSSPNTENRRCINMIDGVVQPLTCNNIDENQYFKLELTGNDKRECRLRHIDSGKYLQYSNNMFTVVNDLSILGNDDLTLFDLQE
jgi:hypothetical protein